MGRNDPYSPDYDPRYQGEGRRDLGEGSDFEVDTAKLYLAGLEHFPVTASTYADAAADLYYVEGLIRSVGERAGRAEVSRAADHALELYEVMRVTSARLYAAGETLVSLADDFAGTDRGVADRLGVVADKNEEVLVDPPPRHVAPEPTFPWSLAIPQTPLPGGGSVPDIPTDDDLDGLQGQQDLEGDLQDHEREQQQQEDGLPA